MPCQKHSLLIWDTKAIRFQKNGKDQYAYVTITLTEEQVDLLKKGGNLSFWYKNNGGASIMVNDKAVSGSEGSWTQLVADEEMLAASASSGTISIRLQTWNAASIWVDDIVVTPMVGYTVEHKYGDTVLKSEFLKGEAGSTTATTATDILGFVASGEITQTTVAADNSTIVVVNYARDIIVYTPYQAFYILLLPFDYTKSFPTGYCQLFS